MSKQVTWLGDDDRSVESITQYGHRFVRGEPTEVAGDTSKFAGNPFFEVGKRGEGEEDAIKRQLDARSVPYRANASADSLRLALAKANKDG